MASRQSLAETLGDQAAALGVALAFLVEIGRLSRDQAWTATLLAEQALDRVVEVYPGAGEILANVRPAANDGGA